MTITSAARVATMERARRALARERRARADAELASARAALLARTGAALDGSLELDQTLRALAGACVPELGSLCVIDVREEDGRTRRFALRRDDGRDGVIERCMTYPPESGPALTDTSGVSDGAGFLLARVTDVDLPALMTGVDHDGLWAGLLPASLMCAPLRVGGRVIGIIGLVASLDRRPFEPSDLELLRAIASRASLAIGNARSFDAARRASVMRDEVLAVVSHDLRNPLATISMALNRLGDDSEIGSRRRDEFLKIAHASVDWMQRMIQDLLDAASIDAGRLSIEPRDSDLSVLVVHAAAMFEQTCADQGITLTTEVPEQISRIQLDPERILQLIGNLLSNAVKFTPRDGRVSLSVIERDREIVVSVRDSGPGIPAGDIPHLFDRFWHARRSARVRGNGLGLSIAKGILDAHGGRIWVETAEGIGSTFSFGLPRATRAARHASIPLTAELPTYLSTAL